MISNLKELLLKENRIGGGGKEKGKGRERGKEGRRNTEGTRA